MISHLQGALAKRHEARQSIELRIDGIGYEVLLPTFVWRALEETAMGSEVELEIFYHVTERQPTEQEWRERLFGSEGVLRDAVRNRSAIEA